MVHSRRVGSMKDAHIRSTSQGRCQLKEWESKWPGISPERRALSEQKTKTPSTSPLMHFSSGRDTQPSQKQISIIEIVN